MADEREARSLCIGCSQPIGALDNIPGFRGAIPIFALDIGSDLRRGNDTVLHVVYSPDPAVFCTLWAFARSKRTVSYANLTVGGKTYGLRNLSVMYSTQGNLGLYFDSTPETRQLAALAHTRTFDPFGKAHP